MSKKKNPDPLKEPMLAEEGKETAPVEGAGKGEAGCEERAAVSRLEAELASANEECAKMKDQLLRLAAEFDNYKKRTAKEKESYYTESKGATVLSLLPVLDSLDRAISCLEGGDPAVRSGVEMVGRQFVELLQKLGVEEIEALGEPFDPHVHNAVMHVEDEEAGENTVIEVLQKGYRLGDRVLRFSMVKVAN